MKIINVNWRRVLFIAFVGVLPFVLMFNVSDAAGGPNAVDQCQTGSPPTGTCHWVTGILNPGANTYFEGMATPQRVLFRGLTGSSHTISFDMQWTKAGKHAYDWPVTWAQAQTLAQSIGHYSLSIYPTRCADLNPGNTTDCELATTPYTAVVPSDPYISGAFALPATDGSTTNKINSFITAYGAPKFEIYSDQPITFTIQIPVHDVANGADSGDSKVTYTINVTGTGVTSPTVLFLAFAAHIAISDAPGDPSAPGTTWGQGQGAKNISGAPYHVQSLCGDGGCSSQDNQLNLNGTPLTPDLVTRISNSTRTLGQPVSDTVTMTLSSSTVLSGYLRFYVCGPTASAQPCLPQYTTKTLVSPLRLISMTASSVVTSSANYSPSANGAWCFLVQWINQDYNSQSWESFTTTNECATYSSATAVALSAFQAPQVNSSTVTLSWTTASEVNTAGFNVYRSEKREGPFVLINSQIIPTASDKVAGGKYQYQDKTVEPGKTYYYQLEDVELGGTTKRHDLIVVNVPAESAIDSNLMLIGSIVGGFVVVASGLFIVLKRVNVL